MLEATIALAVIALVAGTFLWTGPQQARATATVFRQAQALRAAESVLEHAQVEELVAGRRDVALAEGDAPPGARAERTSREIEPGLWEVTSVVRWDEPGEVAPREARLVTWVARERGR
jgi:hypothetical protein